jgi:putative intracellular protease/amidase
VTAPEDGTRLGADLAVADVRQPADVLIIPGGPEWERLIKDDAFLGVVRELNENARATASVCTGAFLLRPAEPEVRTLREPAEHEAGRAG